MFTENEEAEYRRVLRKDKFPVIDEHRNRSKILDISMINQMGLYEVMIIDLRNQEIRQERVQIENATEMEVVDLDSNMYVNEKAVDSEEENSLLSRAIFNDENSTNLDRMDAEVGEYDGNDGIEDEMEDKSNDIKNEEDIEDEVIDDVRDRFKAMIMEGLGNKHWDSEIIMCLEAEKEHLEYFAEKTMNEIIINEDLKFNLQKAISAMI